MTETLRDAILSGRVSLQDALDRHKKPSAGEYVGSLAKGFVTSAGQAIIDGDSAALLGLSKLAENVGAESASRFLKGWAGGVQKAGEKLQEALPQGEHMGNVGTLGRIGSAGASGLGAVGGLVAGSAGIPGNVLLKGATASGLMSAGHGYYEAKANGASEEDAWKSYAANGLVGAAVGAVPTTALNRLGKILARADAASGGGMKRVLLETAKASSRVREAGVVGGTTGGLNAAQTVASNLIAQALYDDDRKWLEGMQESFAGGAIAGALVGALSVPRSEIRQPKMEQGSELRAPGEQRPELGTEQQSASAAVGETATPEPAQTQLRVPITSLEPKVAEAVKTFQAALGQDVYPVEPDPMLADFVRKRGSKLAMVVGDGPLGKPGMYHEGVIVLDANSPSPLAEVVDHEVGHHVSAQLGAREIRDTLDRIAPELREMAITDYVADAMAKNPGADEMVLRQQAMENVEDVSRVAEDFSPVVRLLRAKPEAFSVVDDVGFWRKLVGSVLNVGRSLVGRQSPQEARLVELYRSVARTPLAQKIEPARGVEIAKAIRDFLDSTMQDAGARAEEGARGRLGLADEVEGPPEAGSLSHGEPALFERPEIGQGRERAKKLLGRSTADLEADLARRLKQEDAELRREMPGRGEAWYRRVEDLRRQARDPENIEGDRAALQLRRAGVKPSSAYPEEIADALRVRRAANEGPKGRAGQTLKAAQETIGQGPRFAQARRPTLREYLEKPEDTREQIRRLVQDRMIRVRKIEEAEGRSAISETETLFHGRTQEAARQLEEMQDEAARVMRERGIKLEDAGTYLMARHVAAREKALGPGSAGMTQQRANEVLARARANPGFQEIADIHDIVHTDKLDRLVRSGDVSAEERARLEEKYGPTYTPLKSERDPFFSYRGAGKSLQTTGRFSKQAKGRTSEAYNPLVQTFQDAYESVLRSEKNIVGREVLRFARDTGAFKVYDSRSAIPEKLQDYSFGVKENGQQRYVVVEDKLAIKALKNLEPEQLPSVMRTIQALGRIYTMLYTSRNPNFLGGNWVRDIQTAGIHLGVERSAGMAKRMAQNAPKAMKAAWRVLRDPQANGEYERYFREAREAGGITHWVEPKTLQERAASIQKAINGEPSWQRVGGAMLQFIDDANSAVENSVRLSAYVELRKSGVAKEQAAVAMKELTVNFTKKGEWGPMLNSLYLFFNARVNGTVRVAQVFKRNPEKAVRMAGALAAGGFAMSYMNRALFPEDWDNESPYLKANNAMLETGTGAFKIPLAQGWGMFWHMGAMAEQALNSKRPSLGPAIANVANSISPIEGGTVGQAVAPWFLDPAVSLSENKDFKGSQIYARKYPGEERPYSAMKDRYASEASKALAAFITQATGGSTRKPGLLDVPPGGIDYVMGEAGGGVGRFVQQIWKTAENILSGEEFAWRDFPVLSRFMGDKPRPRK